MPETAYPDLTREAPFDPARQRRIGLTLAAAIITLWLALFIYAVFFFKLTLASAPLALLIVALQTWTYVGLFIIAHDCMHGALIPFRPAANRAIGQLCLALYAGFSFDELNKAHHRHHRFSGTASDPDFDAHPPYGFWHWFAKFFIGYFTWRQAAAILAAYMIFVFGFGASPLNAVVFWAIPSLLSALQLFTFGTYLPHKPGAHPWTDRHNTRSSGFPPWLSLLTCYHFGYHHEHHLYPTLPWWRLPGVRSK